MTTLEKEKIKDLQYKLHYKKGIFASEWIELIELRKKLLIEQGENPKHYNLDSKFCSKKIHYINQ